MTMNKYELALVINAKIEDDARTDAIEKIKALIEKFGGEITNVGNGVRRNSLRNSEDERRILLFHPIRCIS